MYFSGTLSVDPSQVTNIEKIKPQKAFKKMLYHMTRGGIADKLEYETFTAISILQQFNSVFRSMGINNIIRISQDDLDFYLDEKGMEDDLELAMARYNIEMDNDVSRFFKTIYLVLENEDSLHKFSYLLEIRINRSHEVSKYPIEIKVNGLVRDFLNDNADATRKNMESVFSSQQKYNEFMKQRKNDFQNFLHKLELQIKKFIPIDDIKLDHNAKIIIPKDKGKSRFTDSRDRSGVYADDPVFHNYYGFNNLLLCTMLWSDMCHTSNIHIQDTQIMSDDGSELGEIGEEGIDAGDSAAFDPDQEFDQSSIESEFDSSDSSDMLSDSGSDGGWFSSGDDGGGSDAGGCGSSCSSCSSCGGCGGCS